MRYEAYLNGKVAARFPDVLDALAFVCMAVKSDPAAVADVVDTVAGLPFDRAAILAWCGENSVTIGM